MEKRDAATQGTAMACPVSLSLRLPLSLSFSPPVLSHCGGVMLIAINFLLVS